MKDDKFIEPSNINALEQKLKESEKHFLHKPDFTTQSNPIVRKFVEFTKEKYKFSIKDFYFK